MMWKLPLYAHIAQGGIDLTSGFTDKVYQKVVKLLPPLDIHRTGQFLFVIFSVGCKRKV